jgi:hypothetical protein
LGFANVEEEIPLDFEIDSLSINRGNNNFKQIFEVVQVLGQKKRTEIERKYLIVISNPATLL